MFLTTTATILAKTPICEGFRNVAAEANPIQLKLGIEKAVEAVVADIKPVSGPVKGHQDVAYIAAISSRTRQSASPSQMQWTRSARTG